jgi:hypothetical protein
VPNVMKLLAKKDLQKKCDFCPKEFNFKSRRDLS